MAIGVGDQTAAWVGPVVAVEVDEGFEGVGRAALDQFEYRAEFARPSPKGRSEQVAIGVSNQAARWACSIGTPTTLTKSFGTPEISNTVPWLVKCKLASDPPSDV